MAKGSLGGFVTWISNLLPASHPLLSRPYAFNDLSPKTSLFPRDAQRDESRQAKRSLTPLRESRRAEKSNGNERNIDTCEYERCTKQEGLQKKEAKGVSKRLRSSHQATVQILGKRSRKPIDGDFKWRSASKTSIASHALVPTETPMRPL